MSDSPPEPIRNHNLNEVLLDNPKNRFQRDYIAYVIQVILNNPFVELTELELNLIKYLNTRYSFKMNDPRFKKIVILKKKVNYVHDFNLLITRLSMNVEKLGILYEQYAYRMNKIAAKYITESLGQCYDICDITPEELIFMAAFNKYKKKERTAIPTFWFGVENNKEKIKNKIPYVDELIRYAKLPSLRLIAQDIENITNNMIWFYPERPDVGDDYKNQRAKKVGLPDLIFVPL